MSEVVYFLSHRIEVNALYTSTEKFVFLGLIFAKKLLSKRKNGIFTKINHIISCNVI